MRSIFQKPSIAVKEPGQLVFQQSCQQLSLLQLDTFGEIGKSRTPRQGVLGDILLL